MKRFRRISSIDRQGERRFYLGAVVDDLFLATPEFEFDGVFNEAAVAQRCTGEDLSNLLEVQRALNAQYPGSDIITEFAFNGGGIAEKVCIVLASDFRFACSLSFSPTSLSTYLSLSPHVSCSATLSRWSRPVLVVHLFLG